MSIPTLADHLAGKSKPAARVAPTRVHRLGGDEEAPPAHLPKLSQVHRTPKPEGAAELAPGDARPVIARFTPPVTPVIAPSPTPDGGPMPRGHYERKPKADASAIEGEKPRRKVAKKRNGQKHRALPVKVGDASFVIDDRGRMRIKDGQQEISLERADVQRLTTFLERTKSIRV